jgi:hypothetical protein
MAAHSPETATREPEDSGQAMAGIICGSFGLLLGVANMIAGVMAAT